ncbi:MAG: host attachment protein [Candidatus Dormibacteraeota bacterium]|nr:host attachment protein [Candidatus Dormibacteraeota bacterium]
MAEHRASNQRSQLLKRLASLESEQPDGVISLYLDLSQPELATPRARRAEVESLVDRLRQEATDTEEHRTLDQQPEPRRHLERLRELLEDDTDPAGARGIAVFSCEVPPFLRTIRLSAGVEPGARASRHPWLRPLVEVSPSLSGLVLAVANREAARVFELRGLALEEVASLSEHRVDPSHAGQEMAHHHRMENWFKEQARELVRLLTERARQDDLHGIVLVAPAEFLPHLDRALTDELRGLVMATIAADALEWPAKDMLTEVERAAAREAEAHDDELVALLEQSRGQAGSSAWGDAAVLRAIAEQRVAALLLARGRELSGWVCPNCGWMATEAGDCPLDGARLTAEGELIERMIRESLCQDAEVRLLPPERLGEASSAALLRYG